MITPDDRMGRGTPRRVVTLAVAGSLLLGIAACGDGEDQLGPPQPDDGTITVYSGRGEALVGELLEQFQTDTGITIQARYGNTAQMAAQLLEEGDRTPADVFYAQDAGALGAVAKAGMFAALPDQVLDQVPAPYQARGGEWVGITGRARVLVYNPQLVTEAELPETVFELTEPRWRGRVGVAPTNGSFQAFVTGMRVQHGDEATREWLAGIAANEPQIRDSNIPIVADVNDGRIDVGLVNHYYLYERAKEDGVPVEELTARNYSFPDGDIGSMVNVSGVGVLTHSAADQDVRRFVEYLLSETGQSYFAEQTSELPVISGVAGPAGLPELSELVAPDIDLNDLDALEETVVMITESGLA
jgi:iron(III) transport system substrate-binding protein